MAVPELPVPTWFVGCGNMGGAIVEGWRTAGIDLSSAVVIRPSGTPVPGMRTVQKFDDAGLAPQLVVLAFKPQKLGEVGPALNPWLTSQSTVVSLLAGVEVQSLRERFSNAGKIVRAMPNLPVAIRRGVTALYGEPLDPDSQRMLGDLFAALGFAMWAADEAKFAAIGAVAGAGPAYVARFIGALSDAGVERGLTREIAGTIALETVLGTAWMQATTGEDAADVARRVASPNGTTEAGLAVLDPELRDLVIRTIEAAARRGAALAAEAKSGSLAE
ncbi:NAD(P)-binding domain-containing protein [Sphingomonas lutea]|uniref:Pyrroline-5-carboxylate reductase n=1 Tax=Sphingomonas lutea TaxID=1045317 RepID=A0A7G9SGC3_9SPHN|nr:pyrroline-5-carboxylate reductase dimerization domain-containing protein [Sphingomonas lutea]QNN66898.1 NAD(P)-binding domain-containing protein [Sphingomonas lutea]